MPEFSTNISKSQDNIELEVESSSSTVQIIKKENNYLIATDKIKKEITDIFVSDGIIYDGIQGNNSNVASNHNLEATTECDIPTRPSPSECSDINFSIPYIDTYNIKEEITKYEEANKSDNTDAFINRKDNIKIKSDTYSCRNSTKNIKIKKREKIIENNSSIENIKNIDASLRIPEQDEGKREKYEVLCENNTPGLLVATELTESNTPLILADDSDEIKLNLPTFTHLLEFSNDCQYKLEDTEENENDSTNSKEHKCRVCMKYFTRKSTLKYHMMIHNNKRPFQCKTCGYSCTRKGDLERHILTHSGTRPYECKYCDFKTAQKSNLKRHLQVHTGEKPFQCSLCNFKCSLKSGLKSHMMRHANHGLLKCEYCEFSSAHKNQVMLHQMTHTNKQPLQCDKCPYQSTLKGNLRQHMMKHLGIKPYECNQCEYKTAYKGSLNRHKALHRTSIS